MRSIKENAILRQSAWLLSGVAAMAFLTPDAAIAQAAPATEQAQSGIAEIIVTANRREERGQDVPIAITALSPENIRERGITSLQDVQGSVPSLIVAPNGQASRDVMSPSIRGQSAAFQGSPAVVVYMNEVPLPSAFTLSGQGGPGTFVDLQNVQVLTGVQGTLFGRNTTGGAILLTPAKPTDTLGGYVQGGYGNYNMTEFEAVLNVPISDTLKVRLVGSSRDRDGFTYDVNWNKDRDDQHWRAGRIGIQWDPSEKISSYTLAYFGHSKTNGTGTIAKSFNTGLFQGIDWALPQFYNFCNGGTDCSRFDDLIADQEARGNRRTAHGMDDFAKLETWGVSNTLEIALSDELTLRNIASYAMLKSYYLNDSDGTIAPIYDTGVTDLSRTAPRDWYDNYTEELQLQGKVLDGKLNFVVGGFYYKQEAAGEMRSYATNFCDQPTTVGCAISTSGISSHSSSKALYAQGTLDLGALTPALDRLRLTAGYRYTWDNVGGSNFSYNFIPGAGPGGTNLNTACSWDATIQPLSNPETQCLFSSNRKDSAPTWTLGLDYRPVDDLMLYGKVSRGYKAGGFNAYAVFADTRTFGPEFVTDYELGFKSDFFVAGAPVRLNVNGFYLDYSNIQRAAGDFNQATSGNGAITLSTASAVIKGVEVEARVMPTQNLEIGVNYSHLKSHYKSFTFDSTSGVYDCTATSITSPKAFDNADMSCRALQYLSPNILSVHARLSIPMAPSIGDISLFVSYNFTDTQETAPFSEERFADGTLFEPGVRLPSFGLFNASIDWKNALGSGLDATLFGTNLTNEEYVISNTGIYQSIGAQSQIYGEPRMYGLRLRYNFGG